MTATLTPPAPEPIVVDPASLAHRCTPSPRTRWARRLPVPGLDLLFTLVFALFGLGLGIERLSDNSFFTHLVTGRRILDLGIPRVDPYSYTAPGTRWIAQSWLAEAGYALLERTTGLFGVRCLGALTAMAITVLAFRLALRLAGDRLRASGVAVVALGGVYTLWSERPLVLGILALVVLAWMVEVPDSLVGRHPLVAVPVLMLLWANVHGSFALGFAYLGLHLAGRWCDGRPPWRGREGRLATATVLGGLATFVNPYGAGLVLFPVQLLGRGEVLHHVVEWRSPDFHTVRGLAFAAWIVLFVVVVARHRGALTWRDLAVTVAFLVLGLWALRNVAIAPLVALPVVARLVAAPAGIRRAPAPRPVVAWALLVTIVATAGLLVARAAARPDLALDAYPVAAVAALEERGLTGSRLLTEDGGAAWVELHLGSRQRVFLDDRYDMFPVPVIEDYFTVSEGGAGWRRVLDRWDVETVVWSRRRPLGQLLRRDPDWVVVHRDARWATYVRRDVAAPTG